MTSKLCLPIFRMCLLILFILTLTASLAHAKTLVLNSSFSVGSSGIYQGTGIAYDSGNNALWLTDSGGQNRLVRIPITGGSIVTSYSSPSNYVEGLCFGKQDKFVLVDPIKNEIHVLNNSDGSLNETIDLSAANDSFAGVAGISYNENKSMYWVADYENQKMFELWPNTLLVDSSFSCGSVVPEGVAYKPSTDCINIVDRENNKLWKTDQWGSAGSTYDLAARGIYGASGVAYRASDHHLFISDFSATRKIFEVDSSINVVGSFTLHSDNMHPTDVAYHATNNRLYVLDNYQPDKVFVYQTDGTYDSNFSLGSYFSEGICVTADDNLFVLDWFGDVSKWQTDGTFISTQPIKDYLPTSGADVAYKTNYWVTDYQQKKIFKLNSKGEVLDNFSTAYCGCDQPEGIFYRSEGVDLLWVVDSDSDRLYEFNTIGNLSGSYDLSAFGINYPTDITLKSSTGEIFIIDIEDDKVYNMEFQEGGGSIDGLGGLGGVGPGLLGTQGFDCGTLFGFNTRGAGPVEIVDYEGDNVVEITEGITPGDFFPPEGVPPEDYTPDRSVRMYRMIDVPLLAPELSFDFMLGEFYDPNYFAVLYMGDELAHFDINDKTDEFTTVTIDMSSYAGTCGTLEFFMAGACGDAIRDKVYIDDISLTGIPESPSIFMVGLGVLVFLAAGAIRAGSCTRKSSGQAY